jgi:hypothetical protein
MVKRAQQLAIVVLLVAILTILPTYWLFLYKGGEKLSVIEGRRVTTFPNLSFSNFKLATKRLLQGKTDEAGKLFYARFFDKSFQTKFESALSDQFPYRLILIQLEKTVERGAIQLAYAPLNDPAIPISSSKYILTMRNENVLFYPPSNFDQEGIDTRIQNYSSLIKLYPQVRFYIFYVDRIMYSKYNPLASYFPMADNGRTITYFEQHKPSGLVLAKMMLESFQNHVNYFYRTDHHWNINGAWNGYEGMYQMLAPYYPEIGPELTLKQFAVIPGVGFCGSLSRITFSPCQPEPFKYAQVDLPPYKSIVHGKELPRSTRQAQYLAGKFSKDLYTDHYERFFGGNYDQIEYHFQNNAQRNLLLVGSSYTQAMEVYIASHFHDTYVIDLRQIKGFSFGTMIKQYHITDVIEMGGSPDLSDTAWKINP